MLLIAVGEVSTIVVFVAGGKFLTGILKKTSTIKLSDMKGYVEIRCEKLQGKYISRRRNFSAENKMSIKLWCNTVCPLDSHNQ